MAQIIKTDGTIEEIGDGKITLAAAQEAVGGYIEVVTLSDGEDVLVVNEEAHLFPPTNPLPLNTVATMLAGFNILGDVIRANWSQI